jgi:heme-degrading monooxygenase HmoA
MSTISRENKVFTVMVNFQCEPAEQAILVEALKISAPHFSNQKGFVSQNIHRSLDGTTVVSYLQWKSEKDHEACLSSPELMESGTDLIALMEKGKATMQVMPYEIVYTAEARGY